MNLPTPELPDRPEKSALVIRHVPVEGLAAYRQPIEAAGYRIDRIDVADPAFPTLGVCLGAQMIAAALGARVYPGHGKEVGFHPISLREPARDGPLRHMAGVPLLHWHGDTFTLPEGAELLASSERYEHQAFRRGNNVLALQYHAEMGLDPRFDEWLDAWPDAVVEAGGDCESLRAAYGVLGPSAVAAGQAMIAEWLEGLSAHATMKSTVSVPAGR